MIWHRFRLPYFPHPYPGNSYKPQLFGTVQMERSPPLWLTRDVMRRSTPPPGTAHWQPFRSACLQNWLRMRCSGLGEKYCLFSLRSMLLDVFSESERKNSNGSSRPADRKAETQELRSSWVQDPADRKTHKRHSRLWQFQLTCPRV